MIAADGEVVWIYDISRESSRSFCLRRWDGYLVDITSRRLAEEQLPRARNNTGNGG